MNRKWTGALLAGVLCLSMGATGCGQTPQPAEKTPYDAYTAAIDTDYVKEIIQTLSSKGDDPATGNRSAGSPAEYEAADYLLGVFEEAGFANVIKEEAPVDGWTYKGASVAFTDASGTEQKIDLGGYACTAQAKDEEVKLVYAGRGTEADYEKLDVKGKLVLIDINQNEDWWINYPSYQAKLKGAKGVIAMTEMVGEDENRMTSQDITGPADMVTFAISQKDSKALQAAIAATGKNELTVRCNADSTVTKDTVTYNICGEIPGKSSEVIYLFGHYDGYYHSAYDDASGIATAIGIAKAVVDSGYQPDKTIRLIAHGAEEWGKSGSTYDWAAGAYSQLVNVHPEWAQDAFAIINMDGCYPVKGETMISVKMSRELEEFTLAITDPMIEAAGYTPDHYTVTTGGEDYGWTALGIPSIGAGAGDISLYYDNYYHSSTDNLDTAEFSSELCGFNEELFGKLLFELDAKAVRPMDFAVKFADVKEAADSDIISDEELTARLDEAIEAGTALNAKIKQINDDYAKAVKAGNTEASEPILESARELNRELFKLYEAMQKELQKMGHGIGISTLHEGPQENVSCLNGAIAALEAEKPEEAVNRYLTGVDYNWAALDFDKAVCDFMIEQEASQSAGTFGENQTDYPACDLHGVIRSLSTKANSGTSDFSAELSALKDALNTQHDYLNDAVSREKEAAAQAAKTMKALVK